MPPWGWSIVKWVTALAVMAVVVYVSAPMAIEQVRDAVRLGGDDDEPLIDPIDPTETAAPSPGVTPATEEGTASALTAVGARSGIVQDPAAPEVTVGPGAADEMLIAFDPLPADPACLTGVILQVPLLESTETSVHVRPARVPDLAALDSGGSLPANWQVADVEPARAFTSGAPGGLRWDVRDVYSLAVREATPGSNVVLSVTTPAGDPDRSTVLATGAELDERLPFLEWAAIAGCNGLGPSGQGPLGNGEGNGGDNGEGDEETTPSG